MIDLSDQHDDQLRFLCVSFGWKLSAVAATWDCHLFDVCGFILEGIGLFSSAATQARSHYPLLGLLSLVQVACQFLETLVLSVTNLLVLGPSPFHHPFGFKNLLSRRSIRRLEGKHRNIEKRASRSFDSKGGIPALTCACCTLLSKWTSHDGYWDWGLFYLFSILGRFVLMCFPRFQPFSW